MPLTLPPELRYRLLARFEGPEAWACKELMKMELLKRFPSQWEALFRNSWERSEDHQRLFLRGRLETQAAEDDEEAAMVRAWLAYLNEQAEPGGDDPARELAFHQLLGAFYTRYVEAGGTPDPIGKMSALKAEVEQARVDYGDTDEKKALDVLLLDCMDALSVLYQQRDAIRQATEEASAAVARAEAFGLAERAMKNRCRTAALLFAGSRNIDEALSMVLPLWESVRDRPPSLDRANLAYTLAQGYAQTGDRTETRYFLEKIVAELQAIGLYLEVEEPLGTLDTWLNTLPAREPVANYTYERLLTAITLNAQYASLREISTPQPEGSHYWTQTRECCLDLIDMIGELRVYQDTVDECLLSGKPAPEFAAGGGQRLDHSAAAFGRWMEKMYARFAENDQDDGLLAELRGKLAEESVRTDSVNKMLVWQLIGEFYLGRGDTEHSAEALEKAFELATRANRLEEQLHILKIMVGNYSGPAHTGKRLEVCLRAVDLIEKARAGITTPYQRSAFVQDKYEFYALAMKLSWKQQQLDLMFGLMELVKARDYRENPVREGGETTNLRQQLDLLHDENITTPTDGLADIARRRQVIYDTRLLRARGKRDTVDYRDFSCRKIMENLPEGEAVLSYCELMGGVWLFQLIAGGRLLAQERRVDDAWLNERVKAFGSGFPAGYRGRGMEAHVPKYTEGSAAAKRRELVKLTDWLFPEEFRQALVGCCHLRICPHHELHAVPFHALPFGDGYLIEQFAVSYLPNLGFLPVKAAGRSPDHSVALIGTDTFAEVNGRSLTPLPGALEEVKELTAYYEKRGTRVLDFSGGAARRKRILDPAAVVALEGCRVVHLAVHGEDTPAENPMDVRLFLEDGFIDGFDVSLLRLRAELVVLSACFAGARPQGARGYGELAADDMFGLQAAFFAAGARGVLGALWPVEDQAGKIIMVLLHRHLREHPPAEALRLAILEYLRTAPANRRGIIYWGAFFLVEG